MGRFLFWLLYLFGATDGWAAADAGFGGMTLKSGTPDFQPNEAFYRFLSQATLEQGFAMEGASIATSAVVNRHEGWVVGGLLHTFPFGPPAKNLAGKTENTQFSPVFPKFLVGKLWDSGETHWAVGGSILPPIPVNGAAALNIGVDASMAKTLDDGRTRLGVDVDFSFVRATAPVTASKEQMESAEKEGFTNNVKKEVFEERCDPEAGCTDIFKLANLAIKGGMSWQVGERFFPYAQAGITITNEWLYVEYDDTHWAQFGIQPTLHGGAAWTPTDALLLSLGTSLGLKQANQHPEEQVGLFYKLTGSAAYRF